MMNHEEILALEPGLYVGVNEDGEKVVVIRRGGAGFIVKTPTGKRTFWCQEYDEEGMPSGSYPEY